MCVHVYVCLRPVSECELHEKELNSEDVFVKTFQVKLCLLRQVTFSLLLGFLLWVDLKSLYGKSVHSAAILI